MSENTIFFLGNAQDLLRLGFERVKGFKNNYKKVIHLGPEKSDRYIYIEETSSGFKLLTPLDINNDILSFLREEDLLEEFK